MISAMIHWKPYKKGRILIECLALVALLCVMDSDVFGQDSNDQQKTAATPVHTLTLADAIKLSLHANRSLKASEYGVESKAYTLTAAESEFKWKYAPGTTAVVTEESDSIGAGITVAKKFTLGPVVSLSQELFNNTGEDVERRWEAKFGAALTVPLLRGLGSEINLDAVNTAEFSLRSIQRSHQLAKISLVLETVSAVYDIVAQRKLVDLYQLQIDKFNGHAMMAMAKEKIGLSDPIDVYRAQIRLKDAQDSLSRSREAFRNAGDRLKLLLAVPLDTTIDVTAPMTYEPLDIKVEEAIHTAMQNRIELEQIEDEIENVRRSSRMAKHKLKPQLDLVGRYNRMANDDMADRAINLDEDYWSLSLVSTTDWGRTVEKANYQRSLLAVKTAELNRWAEIDGIKREIRQVFDSLVKAEERMKIRNEQIHQARGKLALAKTKFRHGMANNFDVIEAETELQEARTNLLSTTIEHIVGTYRLRASIGTLIEHKKADEQAIQP
jgi:outer membrane protein